MGRGSSKAGRGSGGGGGANDITGLWSGIGNYKNAAEELEDVIHRQGFDGKPKELSGAAFDEAAKKSGWIAVRRVNADSEAQAGQYADQLRNGKFFIGDKGGAAYGHGMYVAGGKGTKVTDQMMAQTGGAHGSSRVETMTLAPGAKVIKRSQLEAMYSGNPTLNMSMSEVASTPKAKLASMQKSYAKNAGRKKFGAMNSYAAAKGYSAIDIGDGNMVILDRSRVILKKK